MVLMRVAWDPVKARLNRRKHGVAFPDAELALYDPRALTKEDEAAEGEQRQITVGLDALGRLVVFAYRGDSIRLISRTEGDSPGKDCL